MLSDAECTPQSDGNGEHFRMLFNRFEWVLNYHECKVYATLHSNTSVPLYWRMSLRTASLL